VVMDIDAAHSERALAELAGVPGTLRSRVLF
jgi:D-3-phosphoglycerate dehydrogenase